MHFLELREVLPCAPPFQRFGSAHPAVFGGCWVHPFLGRREVAFGSFSSGWNLGLGEELGGGASVLERRVGEGLGDFSTYLFHLLAQLPSAQLLMEVARWESR